MSNAAASSSTSSSEAQQSEQVAPACKKSLYFISPEVASYFLGEYLAINKSKDRRSSPARFYSSGRMCGSSFADGCQSSRETKNHPVSLSYLFNVPRPLSPYLAWSRQVQLRGNDSQYKGVWRSLTRMWKEEGFKGFMRGNGINCLRIVPYR